MGKSVSKEAEPPFAPTSPDDLVVPCGDAEVKLKITVFESFLGDDHMLPVEGAAITCTVDGVVTSYTTDHNGLRVVEGLAPGTEVRVRAKKDGLHALQRSQKVTLKSTHGVTSATFVMRAPILHSIVYGTWQQYNPWAAFQTLIDERFAQTCRVSDGHVTSSAEWLSQLCRDEQSERVFAAISNFHGNVRCRTCGEEFHDLPTMNRLWKMSMDQANEDGEEAPPDAFEQVLKVRFVMQRASEEAVRVAPNDEEAQAAEVQRLMTLPNPWAQQLIAPINERLALFRARDLKEAPFSCMNFCLFAAEMADPHNGAEAYIIISPTAPAAGEEQSEHASDDESGVSGSDVDEQVAIVGYGSDEEEKEDAPEEEDDEEDDEEEKKEEDEDEHEEEEEDEEGSEDDEEEDDGDESERINALFVQLHIAEERVPEHLVVLQSCNAGFEPSLARAFLRLGTPYVLAYVKPVLNLTAAMFLKVFYDQWVVDSQTDPRQIPVVFDNLVGAANMANVVVATLPVLVSAVGIRCFDLPHYRATGTSRVMTYAFNVRPYWVFDIS